MYKKVQIAESYQNQKKLGKTKEIKESWLGPSPSKEFRCIFCVLVFFCFWLFFCFPRSLPLFKKSWLAPPPSKEPGNIILFWFFSPRFLPSVGYLKETGTNHRQSCQSALGSAVESISKYNLKSWENCTPRGCRSVKKMISVKSLKTFP